VVGVVGVVGIEHLPDGGHRLVYEAEGVSSQAGLAALRSRVGRPDAGALAMWSDLRAALNNIHQVEFYCGFLPEKPSGMTQRELAEVVRLQLDDARRVLGQLADALADGAAS
jgi:hypothetical protein